MSHNHYYSALCRDRMHPKDIVYCGRNKGHSGDHTSGVASWPNKPKVDPNALSEQILRRVTDALGTAYNEAGDGAARQGILDGAFTTLKALGIKFDEAQVRKAVHDVDNSLWEEENG